MNLLKIARTPALVAGPDDTVMEAVHKMTGLGIGAIAIVEGNATVGIFTERDLMHRVVRHERSPHTTALREVMTANPHVAPINMDASAAFQLMTERRIRHLPLIDADGALRGMLSIRHLMETLVENLSHELEGLNAFISSDGIGG